MVQLGDRYGTNVRGRVISFPNRINARVWRFAVPGEGEEELLYDGSVKRLEDDCDKIMTLGTFDLFEGLNIVVFRAVHDGEDLGHEVRFIP